MSDLSISTCKYLRECLTCPHGRQDVIKIPTYTSSGRGHSRLSYHNKSWIGGQQHFVSLFRVIASDSILKSRLDDDTPANRTTNYYTRHQLHMWTVDTVHHPAVSNVCFEFLSNESSVGGGHQPAVSLECFVDISRKHEMQLHSINLYWRRIWSDGSKLMQFMTNWWWNSSILINSGNCLCRILQLS